LQKLFIILCEGDHDKLFTYQVLKNISIKGRCFSQEHLKVMRIRGGETTIIRDFSKQFRSKQLSRNERAIIKEEGNADNAEEIFIELLKSGDQPCDIFLLIDTDKKKIGQIRRKIFSEIGKDLLKISNCCYKINENKKIFFIPTSLEREIERVTLKKIDNTRHQDKQLAILKIFMEKQVPWVGEFGQLFSS